jgi:serine/threonine protein kinase
LTPVLANNLGMQSYEILRLLGSGAYANAYLARSSLTGAFHVIKSVRPDPRHPCDLQAEGHILAAFNHPHIIKYGRPFSLFSYIIGLDATTSSRTRPALISSWSMRMGKISRREYDITLAMPHTSLSIRFWHGLWSVARLLLVH